MAIKGLIILLLVGNSIAYRHPDVGSDEYLPYIDNCTNTEWFCISCTTALFCPSRFFEPILAPCPVNQVCEYVGHTVGCTKYQGYNYNAGFCDCETIGNRGFLADPYDPSKYIECVPPEYQYFHSCPEGQIFSDETKSCIGETTISTTPSPTGCDCDKDCITTSVDSPIVDPTCQTFVLSFDTSRPPFTLSCPTDEAFDISKLQCVPKCDLAPPSFTCPEEACGAFPDTVDCTIFHVCLNGEPIVSMSGTPCQEGHIFDPKSMMCVDAASSSDVVCPEVNPCWLAHCDACNGTCPAPINSVG